LTKQKLDVINLIGTRDELLFKNLLLVFTTSQSP